MTRFGKVEIDNAKQTRSREQMYSALKKSEKALDAHRDLIVKILTKLEKGEVYSAELVLRTFAAKNFPHRIADKGVQNDD